MQTLEINMMTATVKMLRSMTIASIDSLTGETSCHIKYNHYLN